MFSGRPVGAPGLPGRHRIDWLYSARGLAMQGEGIGADGRLYHFAGPYSLSWHNQHGAVTTPCRHAPGYWDNGRAAWIGPTWLNRNGSLTYPLLGRRWSDGPPRRELDAAAAASFSAGASLPLSYWRDAAVDPRLIARGSRLFIPAYCETPSHGWLVAADTGGAILGRHIDVFRAPPQQAWADRVLPNQRIYVVPPGYPRAARLRCR